jgi:hypothetical protein
VFKSLRSISVTLIPKRNLILSKHTFVLTHFSKWHLFKMLGNTSHDKIQDSNWMGRQFYLMLYIKLSECSEANLRNYSLPCSKLSNKDILQDFQVLFRKLFIFFILSFFSCVLYVLCECFYLWNVFSPLMIGCISLRRYPQTNLLAVLPITSSNSRLGALLPN